MEALFEIRKEHYYHGMWRAEIDNGDFLALMWLEGRTWHLRYRFRYTMDHKVRNSKDLKTCYELTASDHRGAKEKMFMLFNETLKHPSISNNVSNLEFFPICGDGDAFSKLLQSGIEGFHVRFEQAK